MFDVAVAAFRRRGVDETTMREVAEAAGLSLGAAYHYFESKDANTSWPAASDGACTAASGSPLRIDCRDDLCDPARPSGQCVR